nr:immunoglobulin light chain junction region [Macaca mulatta]
CQQNAHWPLTC